MRDATGVPVATFQGDNQFLTCPQRSPPYPSSEAELPAFFPKQSFSPIRAKRGTSDGPMNGFWVKGYAPMLVLSRKKNESIVINNDITITVVEIRGDKVRLGIVAPKEVPVHRQEVYEAIQRENALKTEAPKELSAVEPKKV